VEEQQERRPARVSSSERMPPPGSGSSPRQRPEGPGGQRPVQGRAARRRPSPGPTHALPSAWPASAHGHCTVMWGAHTCTASHLSRHAVRVLRVQCAGCGTFAEKPPPQVSSAASTVATSAAAVRPKIEDSALEADGLCSSPDMLASCNASSFKAAPSRSPPASNVQAMCSGMHDLGSDGRRH
jgi:hypothetical protein